MKRTLLCLSVLAIFGFALIGLEKILTPSMAQQTTATEDITMAPLAIPSLGTSIRGASSDGSRLVFESANNYTSGNGFTVINGNNADGNTEVFVYDTNLQALIQITATQNDTNGDGTLRTRVSNLSPAISGDGNTIVFMSNASLGGLNNDSERNFEIYRATLTLADGATIPTVRITPITSTTTNFGGEFLPELATNYDPTVSDDGSVIAFVSTRRGFSLIPNVTSGFIALTEGSSGGQGSDVPDGNGEVFIFTQQRYSQVTVSRSVDAMVGFSVRGINQLPVLSGNGGVLYFMSAFNYDSNRNPDLNVEIFRHTVGQGPNTYDQVTQTNGNTGDGSDLPAIPQNGPVNILAPFTHPVSADGSRVVFESSGNFTGRNADPAGQRTREVFLIDFSSGGPVFTQITNQPPFDMNNPTVTDLSFLPSINSNGTFISFNTILNLAPDAVGNNMDGSKEVYLYNIGGTFPVNNSKFRQLTYTAVSTGAQDQRLNTTSSFVGADSATEPRKVSFSYISQLIQPGAALTRDLFQALVRPVTGTGQTPIAANGASFDTTQVARGSMVAVFGNQLANSSLGDASRPFVLNNVSLDVNGIAARLSFVSAGQVNFVMPQGVANGDAVRFSVNNNGVRSVGTIKIVDSSPGIMTSDSTATGPAVAQCQRGGTFTPPPCATGDGAYLAIYGTGWANAGAGTQVKIGDQTLTPVFSGRQNQILGLDQINVQLPSVLAGRVNQDISVVITATSLESNRAKISFR